MILLGIALLTLSSADPLVGQGAWTELGDYLVKSDGSLTSSGTDRDKGSLIVFFDMEKGDNAAGDLYWWDGERIIDSKGKAMNPDGVAYGDDPLTPNEDAIKPFQHFLKDPRWRDPSGYADWFLFRRGQTHQRFGTTFHGGRSIDEPLVAAAYGPLADGRAIVKPEERGPFSGHNGGAKTAQFHLVTSGFEIHCKLGRLGTHQDCTSPGKPGVPTWLIEDCKLVNGQMNYLPIRTTFRKSVSAFRWSAKSHNQGYYNSGFGAAPLFEEVIFYKNGYKTDPMSDPDPQRSIFDRNIYQGGGAQMGHTYRNIISADGGSGGPQMRLGGLIENSLIIEGYWFSSTSSNKAVNPWLAQSGQKGRSALVRNNVQFVHRYPSPADPDGEKLSDGRAQPGWGYNLQGASFGALIENNIISGAMLHRDLGFGENKRGGAYGLISTPKEFQDGNTYTIQNSTFRGNIAYQTKSGINLSGNWSDARGHVVENNVLVTDRPVVLKDEEGAPVSSEQLSMRGNRFYSDSDLPVAAWMKKDNTNSPYAGAAKAENWPDPDRTLKRYVTEKLGLTLLDWADDPWLTAEDKAARAKSGEAYDPAGLKTFMAVATNMRRGGADAVPKSGKPSWVRDYPWDARFTGQAVVNWVREGFGMKAVP